MAKRTVYTTDLVSATLVDKVDEAYMRKTKVVFGEDGTYTDVTADTPFPVAATVTPVAQTVVKVALVRNVYSTTPVTTGAYVELIASLANSVTQIFIFDSSGETLVLATGAAGLEDDQYYITPGGNGLIQLTIASGARVSIKAVSANATVGEFNATFLK